MKKMIVFGAVLAALVSIEGCKKYPDGPMISFETRTARVANTWKVASATKNGTDYTSVYVNSNYTETYSKDGSYSYTWTYGSGSGKWAFENSDTQIKRSGVSGQSSVDLTILKLKEKEFWYKATDNGDIYEIHLIPK